MLASRAIAALDRAQGLARGLGAAPADRFVPRAPSPQTAVDTVAVPWASHVPIPGVTTGSAELFADQRVVWAIDRLGGVDGASCVELGPLEGAHSYMLERSGASRVTSVEANKDAFLKCLVVKDLLGMARCSFLCGDVLEYLRSTTGQFDVCWCAGILYHMVDPVELLALISRRASKLYIWTHYYDAEKLPASAPQGVAFRRGVTTRRVHEGQSYTLHRHDYGRATRLGRFWGGTQPYSNWLSLSDLLRAIEHLGWTEIQTQREDDHPHGPALNLTAMR